MKNPLVSISQFKISPSSKDNIPRDLEWKIRSKCCLLIQKSAILLDLKQSAAATAQILFQRFYYVKSLKGYDPLDISLGCLFLACKIEECLTSTKELIRAFDFMTQKGKDFVLLNYYSNSFKEYKDKMENAELIILIALGFKVSVNHPHGFLLNILNSLNLIQDSKILQSCISYLNDALISHIYVTYSAVTIACGVIYLSCLENKIVLHRKWNILFDVSKKDLQDIAIVIKDLYKKDLSESLNDSLGRLSIL